MNRSYFLMNRVQSGYVAMASTGIAYALLGGLTLWFNFQPLLQFGVGEYHLILSAIFLIATAAGFKNQSRAVLKVGFAVFVIDLLMMVRSVYIINHKTYLLPYIVWAFVAIQWAKGVRESR